jgi:Rrf2 family protein
VISQKARYALRALLALARPGPGKTLMIGDIATEQKIPKKFIEQILLELKAGGLVQSHRGRSGGYELIRPAEEVMFGEVLRLIDGPIALLPCLSQVAYRPCLDCRSEESCELRHVFAKVALASRAVLDRTSLAAALVGTDIEV